MIFSFYMTIAIRKSLHFIVLSLSVIMPGKYRAAKSSSAEQLKNAAFAVFGLEEKLIYSLTGDNYIQF